MKKLVSTMLLCAISVCFVPITQAKLVTYPALNDQAVKSNQYRVWVKEGNNPFKEVFVYMSTSDWSETKGQSISWVSYSHDGAVTVKVKTLIGRSNGVVFRPKKYAITGVVKGGNETVFRVPSPMKKISVEFKQAGNKSETPKHALMLFSDPLEDKKLVPNPKSSQVYVVKPGNKHPKVPANKTKVYFSPGVHQFPQGVWKVPASVKQIYIAGGAFLKGGLYTPKAIHNFTLNGRGVISTRHLKRHFKNVHTNHTLFTLLIRGNNTLLEGVVVTDSPGHTVRGHGKGRRVNNLKVMGWKNNNDGINSQDNCVYENMFMRATDDAFWMYSNDMKINNIVVWQMTNGSVFQLGWSAGATNHRGRISNIDVIHAQWSPKNKNPNNAIIDSRFRSGRNGLQSDFVFENITAETPILRAFDLRMKDQGKGKGEGAHNFKNFVFRNFNVRMMASSSAYNYMTAYNNQYGYENIKFENIKINNACLNNGNSKSAGRFKIAAVGKNKNIRFVNTGCKFDQVANITIPGSFESENYQQQQGVKVQKTADVGGGMNVGWIENGDWLQYDVYVARAGSYTAHARVSSASQGGTIQFYSNDKFLGDMVLGNTGGWQSWTTATTNLFLTGGNQKLTLKFVGGSGYLVNMNRLDFVSTAALSADNEAPQVNLIWSDQEIRLAGDQLVVEPMVYDNTDVDYVELYFNNRLVRRIHSAPYLWGDEDTDINNLTAGEHTLMLRAVDISGNRTEQDYHLTVLP